MIFTMENTKVLNIDNEFQLTVLSGKTGQKISRAEFDEQPYYDKIEYLENYKIYKSLNNYLFMKGKIKIFYEWETDEIAQTDIDKIQELNTSNPEDSYANKTLTDNSYSFEIDMNGYVTEWHERSINYELATKKAGFESLQDDTIMICCLQNNYGYKFYNVDIQPNQSIETNKIGSTTYLLVGEKCEVTVPATSKTHTFEEYDCKKLTSSTCSIKNISTNICRAIMICK